MTVGLAIMRLQPLHLGHQLVINRMLAENDKGFLLIGSAETRNENNPFTFAARRMMVNALYEHEIAAGRLTVLPVSDINNPPKWVEHALSRLGGIKPSAYYCGDAHNGLLWRQRGFRVRILNREIGDLSDLSATKIRAALKQNDPSWKNCVPAAVVPLIKKFQPRQNIRRPQNELQ